MNNNLKLGSYIVEEITDSTYKICKKITIVEITDMSYYMHNEENKDNKYRVLKDTFHSKWQVLETLYADCQ